MQGRKIESFSCACINTSGLPWWLSSRKSACQCKRPRFDPWVGKIPWRRAWLPTLVFWPGEYPWTEDPGGLQSMESQRVGLNCMTKTFTFKVDEMA